MSAPRISPLPSTVVPGNAQDGSSQSLEDTATFSPSRGKPSAGTESGPALSAEPLPAAQRPSLLSATSPAKSSSISAHTLNSGTGPQAPATRNSSRFTSRRNSSPQTTTRPCAPKCFRRAPGGERKASSLVLEPSRMARKNQHSGSHGHLASWSLADVRLLRPR
jgi:hypothetical protein